MGLQQRIFYVLQAEGFLAFLVLTLSEQSGEIQRKVNAKWQNTAQSEEIQRRDLRDQF